MIYKYIYSSLTRISDLSSKGFEVEKLDKSQWQTGDYVVCKIIAKGSDSFKIELPNGRMRGVMGGESLVGALGERHATLEATGTWRAVEDDDTLHVLTGGGLLGKLTSKSVYIHEMTTIKYLGHAFRNGEKLRMEDFVKPVKPKDFTIPVVLFVGTSMSAGKTTSARIITNIFKMAGLKVVGAKITGAGRYKDILAIKDVGADAVFDFVDAGLPSSICEKDTYLKKVAYMKNLISSIDADVAVIEIGASPLEPYNGDLAIEAIRENVKCIILSASDSYAVYGLMKAFNIKPDVVTGVSTNTIAGSELVEKLCGVTALNLIDPRSIPKLKEILNDNLGFEL
ncbi:MAG: hypothetical protein P8K68_07760 [Algibacter sp.]|uniref:hypothetical protein n=1 Tax=Algibacter sp. TaxID=1872428 RepID=UPI002605352B|nr:hypothetical protein [Algibacter sp.]MDG1729480.1 hypothetical protein [Algibacter sp.]MDG2178666.1 hypothetical protein [Algibacter sp.]